MLAGNQVDTQASDTNWKENLQTVDKYGKKYIMLPTRVALKDDGWTWKYLPKTRFFSYFSDSFLFFPYQYYFMVSIHIIQALIGKLFNMLYIQ